MMQHIALSSHALHRSAQRNITAEDIAFIVKSGHQLRRTGTIFCQLRRKDVPSGTPGNHRYWQLVGTTVVLCRCGQYVITVYREGRAFHRDACKRKYALPQDAQCPCCSQPRIA